jgi:hypothetical protein
VGAGHLARRGSQRAGRIGSPFPGRRLRLAHGIRRAPADRGHAGLPHRLGQLVALVGARLSAERDDVGELAGGLEVAERSQARQPQRVEPIARQQRQIGLDPIEQAGLAVVQQLALPDRLDDEGDVGLVAGRARP